MSAEGLALRRTDGSSRQAAVALSCALTGLMIVAALMWALPTASASASEFLKFESFTAQATNADGSLDTVAGSHPYEATTAFTLNNAVFAEPVKDLEVNLPLGFVPNPMATPQCSQADFENVLCPQDTQIGQATSILIGDGGFPEDHVDPVYNLSPVPGHTAEFGFHVTSGFAAPILIVGHVGHVRGDSNYSDYGVTATISDIPSGAVGVKALLIGGSLTFWGVPADPSHDPQRGLACDVACSGGGEPSDAPEVPFLTNPRSCSSGTSVTTIRAESWVGSVASATAVSPEPTGCENLAFRPSIAVTPERTQADEPSGYTVDVRSPQYDSLGALGTPELKNSVVTLPAGVSIDPSAANGLQGCSDQEIGIGTENPVSCPSASKIGTVSVTTPLLPGPLTGSIYVGDPLPGDPYRIFLDIEGFGVSVRIPGEVKADPNTGRLTAVFDETPQLPFSELELHFFGGPRAALANPTVCGPATTTSDLSAWSTPFTPDAEPSSSFVVDWDGAGGACPSQEPFAPSFSAGSESTQAGAFSPFTLTLSRQDREQTLSGITVHTPPGLLGMLSQVSLCPEPQASQGDCSPASLIGHTTAGAGPGPAPFYLGGQVFLTGPYKGAPFGMSVVVPVIAGPYNLGTVVVRARIYVDPHTAQLTIVSDPLPQILQGIPLRLRTVNVTIDRPGFILNPTNCGRQSIGATVISTQGAGAGVSSPFEVGGCAGLAFKPSFTVATQGRTSKADGASLRVRVAQQAGEANIHSVRVELPKILPSRLTTLQKACPEATFQANPAACDQGSLIGTATAYTPLLSEPLAGPAYFVSHGGAKFPELILVLQGEGVTIELDGETFIAKDGITSSTFGAVPDAQISSFELNLPEGPNSALAANGNLCDMALAMPTDFVAQNGATLNQSTRIEVEGCSSALSLISKKIHGKTIALKIAVPEAGELTATGRGLAKGSKSSAGRETVTIVLYANRKGRFSTKLKLSFAPKSGKHLAKSVSVIVNTNTRGGKHG